MKLLDFYADWCGQCKIMDPIIHKFAEAHNLPLEKINAEEDEDSVDKFGIRNLPTFVLVEDDGTLIAKRSGACPETELNKWYDEVH